MISKSHKKVESPSLTGALVAAGEALEVHRRMSVDIQATLSEFTKAMHDMTVTCHKMAGAFKSYSDVLTNESEPEVAIAKKGATKTHDFFERLYALFNEATGDVEQSVVDSYQRLVDITIDEARESVRRFEKVQGTYEAVKKKSSEAIAKRKSITPAKLKEAQDEQEAARNAYVKAEKEALASHAIASNASYIQSPKSFGAVFRTFGRLFEQGAVLLADMEPYNAEFLRAEKEFEIQRETRSDSLAMANAQKEAVTALIEQEQQYISLLTVLGQIRGRVSTERAALKVTDEDISWIFSKIPAITALHTGMLTKLQKAAAAAAAGNTSSGSLSLSSSSSSGSLSLSAAQGIAEVFNEKISTMEDLYVPYIENQTRAAAVVEQMKKSKHFLALMKTFEQQCALAGMAVFDFLSMLSTPCRHVHKTRVSLQAVMDSTPTEDKGWSVIHDTLERFSELLDKFDEAKIQSEHIKHLLRIKERLPEEDIVDGSRLFLNEGDLYVLPSTNPTWTPASCTSSPGNAVPPANSPPVPGFGGKRSPSSANQVPPLPPQLPRTSSGETPPLPPSLSSGGITPRMSVSMTGSQMPSGGWDTAIVPNHHYHVFLFNDVMMISRLKKKTSDQTIYKVHMRLPVHSLTLPEVTDPEPGKYVFRVESPKASLRFAASSEEQRNSWVTAITRAVNERKQTQVFGVPLNEIMKRLSERGRDVPMILDEAIAFIDVHGYDVEGVFRVCSSSADIARLQCRIDSGKPVHFTEIHNTTGLLKAWLRALPTPLMVSEMYQDWVAAIGSVEKLRACVAKLPKHSRFVLSSLTGLLKRVSKKSDINLMDEHNLAVVIAPNVLYPKGGSDYLQSSDPCAVVENLISHYDEIFSEVIREQEDSRANATLRKTETTKVRRERLRRIASKKEVVPAEMLPLLKVGTSAVVPNPDLAGNLSSSNLLAAVPPPQQQPVDAVAALQSVFHIAAPSTDMPQVPTPSPGSFTATSPRVDSTDSLRVPMPSAPQEYGSMSGSDMASSPNSSTANLGIAPISPRGSIGGDEASIEGTTPRLSQSQRTVSSDHLTDSPRHSRHQTDGSLLCGSVAIGNTAASATGGDQGASSRRHKHGHRDMKRRSSFDTSDLMAAISNDGPSPYSTLTPAEADQLAMTLDTLDIPPPLVPPPGPAAAQAPVVVTATVPPDALGDAGAGAAANQ